MQKVIALLSISMATLGVAGAQDKVYTEKLSNYGTFSQLNKGVTGSDALREQACAPAAVANGLQFLSNTFTVPNLMQAGYGTVNSLVTDMGTNTEGTRFSDIVTGTVTYLGPSGQGVDKKVSIAGAQRASGGTIAGINIQKSDPTAMQLYNWLTANDAVSIAVKWTSSGDYHRVSLYGIDIIMSGGQATGTGSLSIVDPQGGAEVAGGNTANAVAIQNISYKTVDGAMFITGGWIGGGAASNTSTATIVNDMAIQVTPEPTEFAVLGLGLLGLGLVRHKRR